MHVRKPLHSCLAFGLFQHKESIHLSSEAEKMWTFTLGTVPGTRKDAMVSDLRISESNEKERPPEHSL